MPNPNLPKATDLSYIRDQDELRTALEAILAASDARIAALESRVIAPPTGGPPTNSAPVASFTSVRSFLVATFTDTSTDPNTNIASWEWNFGDSSSSTSQNPVHTYAASGTYTVTLTVTDSLGLFDAVSHAVTVLAAPAPGEETGGTWGVAPYNGTITHKESLADQTSQYDVNNTLTGSGKRLDLTNTRWVDATLAGVSITHIGNGDDVMVRGGYIFSNVVEYNGSNTTGWNAGSPQYHDFHGMAHNGGKRKVITDTTIRNVGDGIQFDKSAIHILHKDDNWLIRGSALIDLGDDAVEDDDKSNGTVRDCFISACSIFSSRPGTTNAIDPTDTNAINGTTTGTPLPAGTLLSAYNASAKTFTSDGNILWLKGKRFSDLTARGGALGDRIVFTFHKWQSTTPANGMGIVIKNCIYREDSTPGYTGGSDNRWGSLPVSKIKEQSNNVLLMPNRASGLPPGWPTTGLPSFTYLWGQAAKDYWNNAINAWVTAHPLVTVPTASKGLF